MKSTLTLPLLLVVLAFAACGPDPAPSFEIPSWAKVAPEQIAEAKKHGVPVAFENDLGMRFVLIPAGRFLMGSPEDEEGRGDDETQHEVTITKPYYMQITEVTNAHYRRFKPGHDSATSEEHPFRGDSLPVVMVSWKDATAFATWVSRRDALREYRLPTEADWEYTCRAGTTTRFWSGDTVEDLARVAWYSDTPDDADAVTYPVGEKAPNPWGLYDMHGNVWEHCQDWYAEYGTFRVRDPQGPPQRVHRGRRSVSGRVARGGSAISPWYEQRSSSRLGDTEDSRCGNCGFRLISPLPEWVEEPTAHPLWVDAMDAIAGIETYRGLGIVEQEGLVPLGPDPGSGLYEFAVEGSGSVPVRGRATGDLMLTDDFAIVLVLIPGGTFWMGAQKEVPERANYDLGALRDESPVHEVTISPFFLAKYAATRAQWTALGGEDRSHVEGSGRLPVEKVSWYECRETLGEHGLALPTEAQWEYACRAGTTTPYWAGTSGDALARVAWLRWGTGGTAHPVGRLPPNAFGLHDMHGNVLEWCEDRYHRSYEGVPTDGSAWVEGDRGDRVSRGGYARSAHRKWGKAEIRYGAQGLRPARQITAE